MKRILLLILLSLTGIFAYSQSAKQMLAEINGHWELDDNNNVTIVKVIEAPDLNKDEIFNRALNYFTYNYVSGKSVIQTQDRDNGLIVGKGIYNNIHKGISILTTYIDAWHVLRVDVKNGRARVIVSLTDYDKKVVAGESEPTYSTIKIANSFPINPKGGQKTIMTKAFYKAYHRAFDTLENVEKAIKDGSTSKMIENSDW